MRARLILVVVLGASASAVACASVLGVEDGVLEADAGADATALDAASTDSSTVDATTDAFVEAAPDARGDAVVADTTAPPGDAGSPDGCAARVADEVQGVFVLPTGMDDQTCGSRSAPCLTLGQGIARAHAQGKPRLYVGPGTYRESVALLAGLTLEGAWDVSGTTWSPDCTLTGATMANIEAPADAGVTVVADGINGASTLRLLNILSKPETAVGPGESLTGVLARGASTQLTLDTVLVTVAAGGAALAGDAGGPGASATATGCSASDGGPGSVGAPGDPSEGGVFTSGGWVPGPAGSGYPGSTGNAGDPGGDGGCLVNKCAACVPGNCGGLVTVCGSQGESGCGGGGGFGGNGGFGGGSSVALYVWGATVTCVDSVLTAGNGGAGGAGGAGGGGGSGSTGAVGASSSCNSICGMNASGCVAVGATLVADGGSPGGSGGQGGTGAQGGGGAGGWSCGAYANDAGALTLTRTSALAASFGAGGAPGGAPGQAKGVCP